MGSEMCIRDSLISGRPVGVGVSEKCCRAERGVRRGNPTRCWRSGAEDVLGGVADLVTGLLDVRGRLIALALGFHALVVGGLTRGLLDLACRAITGWATRRLTTPLHALTVRLETGRSLAGLLNSYNVNYSYRG